MKTAAQQDAGVGAMIMPQGMNWPAIPLAATLAPA